MHIVRCDRCGKDLPLTTKMQGKKETLNDKPGRYSFEAVNAEFVAEDGTMNKVDLCAGCIGGIARGANRGQSDR